MSRLLRVPLFNKASADELSEVGTEVYFSIVARDVFGTKQSRRLVTRLKDMRKVERRGQVGNGGS